MDGSFRVLLRGFTQSPLNSFCGSYIEPKLYYYFCHVTTLSSEFTHSVLISVCYNSMSRESISSFRLSYIYNTYQHFVLLNHRLHCRDGWIQIKYEAWRNVARNEKREPGTSLRFKKRQIKRQITVLLLPLFSTYFVVLIPIRSRKHQNISLVWHLHASQDHKVQGILWESWL